MEANATEEDRVPKPCMVRKVWVPKILQAGQDIT